LKISFISVFPPYRGGISNHSNLILNELKNNNDIHIVNFKKLYPSIFFPGKSQYDDKCTIGHRSLSSTNPITWMKVVSDIKSNDSELLIIKFWHPFFIPCYRYIAKKIKKTTNCKVIIIYDNIFPHESFPFVKFLLKRFLVYADAHIVQSAKVERELKQILSNPIYDKVFHPIYDNYSDSIDKEDAKLELKIQDSNIILFFGLIRKYKGLDLLISSMEKVFEKNSKIKLLIAGECYGEKKKYISLIEKSKYSNRIYWVEEYIKDSEVNLYFSASDVVVLPYISASQSGIIPLAYNYNKPVIVSNLEGLAEVVNIGKTGYVFNSKSKNDLSIKILDFFDSYDEKFYVKNIKEYKNNFKWSNFVKATLNLINKLDK